MRRCAFDVRLHLPCCRNTRATAARRQPAKRIRLRLSIGSGTRTLYWPTIMPPPRCPHRGGDQCLQVRECDPDQQPWCRRCERGQCQHDLRRADSDLNGHARVGARNPFHPVAQDSGVLNLGEPRSRVKTLSSPNASSRGENSSHRRLTRAARMRGRSQHVRHAKAKTGQVPCRGCGFTLKDFEPEATISRPKRTATLRG